jgi:hypothetical protein
VGSPGAASQCGPTKPGCNPNGSGSAYYQSPQNGSGGTAPCTQYVPHDYCGGAGLSGFAYEAEPEPMAWAGGGGGGGGGFLGGGGGGGGAIYWQQCSNPCSPDQDTVLAGGGGGGAGGASYLAPGAGNRFAASGQPFIGFTDSADIDGSVTLDFVPVAVPKVALAPARFAPQPKGGPIAKGACTRGTHVRYLDDLATDTTFTVLRAQSGRLVAVGRFVHHDRAGKNRFRFSGRVKGRPLKPGSYELQAVPRYKRKATATVTVPFTIVHC